MAAEFQLRVERSTSTLRERTLETLRQAILTRHFKPGDRLVERDLCNQLEVSRSVVREVLRHLEAEGIIENLPNVGPAVARLSLDEARQIYEIRGQLEALAARACAARRSAVLAQNLATALDAIKAAYKRRSNTAVLSATQEFYRILFDGAGKGIAWTITTSLNARINHLRAITIATPGRDTEGPRQMELIVEAIREGNKQAAARACLAHVARAAEIAEQVLLEQAKGQEEPAAPRRRVRRTAAAA